jgi:3-hydroxyacyl-CoA dehydrogenase
MGPFAVADMSGLDIAWRMRQARPKTPDTRYVDIPDKLCERGRLGRKTGAGYYAYETGRKSGFPDPVVRELVDKASAIKGIQRRELSEEEIQRRALLTMVNEAALLLGEGVASQPSDVDVVLANGYGFPKWHGGPVYWATKRNRRQLEDDIDWLATVSGPGFVRADLSRLFSPSDR